MNKLLSRYFDNNFFLIPIRQNDKRPVYKKWNQYSLSYNEARGFINGGFNLAVVAKDLWIIDYDNRTLKAGHEYYRVFNTWVQFTPRGFHIFVKLHDGGNPLRIAGRFSSADTIRHGDMYALVAPSKIDGKSYWWLDDCKGEILTL